MITYKIKVKDGEMLAGVKGVSRAKLNSAIHLAVIDIQRDLQLLIQSVLSQSPEYQSLESGVLKDEFAVENPELPLGEIVATLQRGIFVTTEPVRFDGIGLKASIDVRMIRSDLSDLLSLVGIDWLEPLLTKGDSIIIVNAHFNAGKSTMLTPGRGFRVPPEFSGTLQSNWITRAFDLPRIQSLVFDIMTKALQRRI